ncbi:MAG: AbgT family transporter [Candidatus Kapabacteria bacterium]|nr:AbgT family transporter [Ignavibacteria bacterium]MBP6508975.1 AbgT family transporter [Candidatus Kapabacteria bacterium]MBK6420026.1 AbgT family transporter [Ignavibacteria bacterium]MBK6759342.1 AbgT family transporter [Ignavibacteria bacterium]MBK7034206.1 AbgT family transporter [Ignavibacteria bacterium]
MKKNVFLRFLDLVERAGNRLPDPLSLFAIAAVIVVGGSWLASYLGVSVIHPGTGKSIAVVNLLAPENIRRMFTDAVANFTAFPPLGLVLVTMIGIAIAERGGFITALLRVSVHNVPRPLLTASLVFAGVNSSLVADAGYVVLIPLGAVIFAAVGRHPLAGLSATFAGVAGGFSANLSITSLDPLLGGLTQSAAQLISPTYVVSAAANWYFMIASTFLLTVVGTWVCDRIIEPRLGPWTSSTNDADDMSKLSPTEKKGLLWSGIAFVVMAALIALISIPEGSILRDEHGGMKPLEKSIVVILMVMFFVMGLVYGKVTGSIRNDKDIADMAGEGMATLGGYIVLSFVMAQFIAYFGWSNLGVVTAVSGAEFLKSMSLQGPVLLVAFVVVAMIINLLIASASAKWAIMAPVFVPMFMLMGISPEATQAAYRIGDSSTNMIAPLLSYIPLILVAMRRYVKDSTLGTLLSLMLPYSIFTAIAWTIFMLIWLYAGIPLGPGVSAFYAP